MQNRHHQEAAEPVMLGPAFQTCGSLEKLHGKFWNHPDPDIFAMHTEEKEMIQAIGALKSALTVLKKHNSFLQEDSATGVLMTVKKTLSKSVRLLQLRHKYDIEQNYCAS